MEGVGNLKNQTTIKQQVQVSAFTFPHQITIFWVRFTCISGLSSRTVCEGTDFLHAHRATCAIKTTCKMPIYGYM